MRPASGEAGLVRRAAARRGPSRLRVKGTAILKSVFALFNSNQYEVSLKMRRQRVVHRTRDQCDHVIEAMWIARAMRPSNFRLL